LPAAALGGCEPHSPLPAPTLWPDGAANRQRAGDIVVYQQFPPTGTPQTAWFITLNHVRSKGLFTTAAWFKPGMNKRWVRVFDEAGPADVFVPYRTGEPRYSDLRGLRFHLEPAEAADPGRCGQVVDKPNTPANRRAVVRELIDKGMTWLRASRPPNDGHEIYRGTKMTLWGTINSENYRYVLSYSFHDDGQVEFRVAATGANLPNRETMAHTHNVIWRINMRITENSQPGAGATSVSVMRHMGNPDRSGNWERTQEVWQDQMMPFNREGSIEFIPQQFTALHVRSVDRKNARGSASGYMIMPLYRGLARHREPFLRRDAWVTRFKDPGATNSFAEDDVRCLEGVETFGADEKSPIRCRESFVNGEAIDNTRSVIWLVTSTLHTFRDEDGQVFRQGSAPPTFWGTAVAMWNGFDLKPHNLFDATPFLPPPR
jgi:hypothetical protein